MNPNKSEPIAIVIQRERSVPLPVHDSKAGDSNKSLTRAPDYYDKRVYCAAIKEPDGRVWTGHRHGDCF